MQFTKIDINNWTRKEYFDHYFDNTPCTYSMTVKLDISKLKKDGKKLYPTLLYRNYVATAQAKQPTSELLAFCYKSVAPNSLIFVSNTLRASMFSSI